MAGNNMTEERKERKKINEGSEKTKEPENYDKILKVFLIIGIIVIVGFIGVFLTGKVIFNQGESFVYKGVNFTRVVFCDAKPCLTTYNTKIPYLLKGKPANQNFFFRNDPRKLEEEILFEGEMNFKNEMNFRINITKSCEGDEFIAMENFGTTLRFSNIKVNATADMTCGVNPDKMYVTIEEDDKTWIEQTGDSCYTIHIGNCEIIKGTERFIYELLPEVHKRLNSYF